VLFSQLKREIDETEEDFYGRLLEAGNKAFTEESGQTIDRKIRDQFIVRNDDATRLYLIQKCPQTAREALLFAISFQAARNFNDMVKETAVTIASTGVNSRENRAAENRKMNRKSDRRASGNSQVFFSDDYQSSSGESSRNSSRESSPEISRRSNRNNSRRSSRSNSRRSSRDISNSSRESSRDRYFSSPHGRYTDSYSGGLEPRKNELYPYSYTEGDLVFTASTGPSSLPTLTGELFGG
jgi:hypothetical protein